MRRVSQRDMKLFLRVNFSEPMNSIWIHGVFYYKYNAHSYQRFPIDLWEDVCAWLKGNSHVYFLKWTAENVLSFSNMNHTCPYNGSLLINIARMPINRIIMLEPFLPSGRYRVDLNATNGFKKPAFMTSKFFFGISDNRIEQF